MTVTHQDSSPIPNLLSQHADQASFLWGLRTTAVSAPHYDLADLAKLDMRVEAHIDGLRIAGEEGWELCRSELSWEEPGEIFAAAVLALESGSESKIQTVLQAVAKKPEVAPGFISALGWFEYPQAEPHIKSLCASPSSTLRRIGIAAAAIHRKDPGPALRNAISDPDLPLRARALRAVGELGRLDLVSAIQNDLRSQDAGCRFWAAWSTGLLTGYGNAIEALIGFAQSPGRYQERALQLALRKMNNSSAHAWQQFLARTPKLARVATIAAGIIGDPVLIPCLIEQMKIPPLARVAGEAFSMMTGVDIAYEDLDAEKPEGFEAGPTENPEDEDVEMDPDERLPWPDPHLITAWYGKHANELQSGIRHLLGKPMSSEWLHQVLRIGFQRQRAAAALELAIRQPGNLLFETRAPAFRQQAMLNLSPRGR